MHSMNLAFDRSTARTVDVDGRLHVDRSHITKAAVNPYYGHEIPGFQKLGLLADSVYKLLRDPAELEKAAPTFARLPILKEHVGLNVDNVANDEELKKLIIGAVGSDVVWNAPYIDADTCFWDANAIAGIDTDKIKELSCSYHFDPDMTPGEFNGEAYDGRMTNIRGNHLALVESGRAGSDVVVSDSNPFSFEAITMKMTKRGKALYAALCQNPVLAKDAALGALVHDVDQKKIDAKEFKAKILAMDSTLEPKKMDAVVDSMMDVDQNPTATEPNTDMANDSPGEKIKGLLSGKVDQDVIDQIVAMLQIPTGDEKDEALEKKMDEKMEVAKDSLRREFRDAADAREDVRETVGVVAMDSAAEIYGFALDHLKIDRKGVDGVPALRALFKVAASKTANNDVLANDSAGDELSKLIPNVNRIQ